MSAEVYSSGGRDEEDFDFLDDVGQERPQEVRHPPTRREGEEDTEARTIRRRNRPKRSRRYNKQDYVQISGVVSRQVKGEFDIALAREKVETGKGRKQFEVLESLMRFYAEEGDPYQLLE